jgi:uncharacterized protein (TIGR00288 family)
MNSSTTETTTRSTRIAVFIDFDNVEIGVKSTIGGQFDIGLVLEAIKERGEIVTKIAYSDWKRAGDYSRILTQHAIRMVQRSFTPGGDKNGADITMALDALEMAFTHDHINAFVIVGGDSDFISLVEKLKQYGRKVIVVGGRQFTSLTMQKNCHEFIAYENLVNTNRPARERDRGGKQGQSDGRIITALPLVKRALKVLSDREVTPQLGLLKSTLLQLDSTFSERNYGASSFRDFMEKVAHTGAVTLKQAGRSMLVEPNDDVLATVTGSTPAAAAAALQAEVEAGEPETSVPTADAVREPREHREPRESRQPRESREQQEPREFPSDEGDEESLPQSPMTMQDGIRDVQQAFTQSATPPRWPMYVRQAKQYLRNAIENFDERKYGFASVVDLLRAAGKEGVLRIERDRQGAVRIFPGNNLQAKSTPVAESVVGEMEETVVDMPVDVAAEAAASSGVIDAEPVVDAPIVDVEVTNADGEDDTDGDEDEDEVNGNVSGANVSRNVFRTEPKKPIARKRKAAAPRPSRVPRAAAKTPRPRARKTSR